MRYRQWDAKISNDLKTGLDETNSSFRALHNKVYHQIHEGIQNCHNILQRNYSLRIGDVAKGMNLFLCVVFFCIMIMEHLGFTSRFSESYKEDGFCVSGKDSHPVYQSHSVCFLANSLTAALMIYLVSSTKMTPEAILPMKRNAISLFAHGCGHLFLFLSTQASSNGASKAFETLRYQGPLTKMIAFCGLFGVWYGFMRDPKRSARTSMLLALFHNSLQFFVLPTHFFFVHVLMAVVGGTSLRGIWFQEGKDIFYDLEAVFVDVPIMMMTFTEAMACDSFLASVGGHLWFDMVVPFGFYVYYGIVLYTGHGLEKVE